MIHEGHFAAIHYTGKFDDGEVFDSSVGGDPFEFQVGTGSVIPGLDRAVIGMKADEEKDVSISPEDAYGEYNEALVKTFDRTDLKADFDLEKEQTVLFRMENGATVPGLIEEVGESEVVINFNHPLAGKTLHFHIKVVEINDEQKYSSGCGTCDDSCDDCSP
jgi:peptidylprolyl isomerase